MNAFLSWLEVGLIAFVGVLSFVRPFAGDRVFAAFERTAGPVLWRPRNQLIAIALLAIAARAALLPWIGPPEPYLHDEYSILMQAQTFASGRLTNPPHPLWIHFEAPHVNHQPTYSSAFFPGKGLHVAAGYLLGGPWLGVWLSVVGMCVAICWMLQAFVPLPYAFVGGALAVVRFGISSYWINSYWGAPVTALGAALALGAVPRIMKQMSLRHGAALGAGVFLLAVSRPYEGLLFCIPLGVWLAFWLYRTRPDFKRFFRLVFVPAGALSAAAVALIILHAWKVTGEPALMAYTAHRRIYAAAPAFILMPLSKPPEYRHERLRRFYEWETLPHQNRKYRREVVLRIWNHVGRIWSLYVGLALTIPVLVAVLLAGTPVVRILIGAAVFFGAGYFLETWTGNVHYAAPVTALSFALIGIGLHRIRHQQWRSRPFGLLLSRALPLVCLAVALVPVFGVISGRVPVAPANRTLQNYLSWCCLLADTTERSKIAANLLDTPGEDLVLVAYSDDYNLFDDWVYNDAGIDRSPVIWAHDLGPEQNRRLLEYYKGRNVWTIRLSPGSPPALTPYDERSANRFAQPSLYGSQ